MCPDWREHNVQATRDVLVAKFEPGTHAAQALLATGSARLVEHIPVKGRDAFWGDDSDGSGQNMLGQLLMERRQRLSGGN